MAVLRIAKLRPGAGAYQLYGVAEGLDAYYTGAGEAPGPVGLVAEPPLLVRMMRWMGRRCGR